MDRHPSEPRFASSRRRFVQASAVAAGAACLGPQSLLAAPAEERLLDGGKVRRVVWLFMAGGPSQIDLYDPKPALARLNGQRVARSELADRQFAFPSAEPRWLAAPFRFQRYGQSGLELSELLPNLGRMADELCLIRSLTNEAIHHAPAQLLATTGQSGLGSESLAALVAQATGQSAAVLLSGAGLPAAGQNCWSGGTRPAAVEHHTVRSIRQLNEPEHVARAYGAETNIFAANCLRARQLLEQGTRFVQLCHRGWDAHGTSAESHLPTALVRDCRQIDRAMGALLADLKTRGLLDSTLVVCSSEFGRSPMAQQPLAGGWQGRDHQSAAFSGWLAGAGVTGGSCWGSTNELGLRVTVDPVDVRQLSATVLRSLGILPSAASPLADVPAVSGLIA